MDIFIIGCKGIPPKYGGFETFVDKLTKYRKNKKIKYHVACLSDNNKQFYYNESRCFNIKVKNIGSGKAVIYDIKALRRCEKYIDENNLNECIIYILACRIGFFLRFYKKRLARKGIKVYVNPDGHEWKRSKWNKIIKSYWKLSERLMIKEADLVICDSKAIENYIKEKYYKYSPKTTFIAYGANVKKSEVADEGTYIQEWYEKFNIKANEYYLIVGRFVPENNYEIMIREFMKTRTSKNLVIITNVEKNRFYSDLVKKTNFDRDERIKFVGTVYNDQLLKKIRENAYVYLHGHEVGGTNPSLLEALSSTNLNLLLDVNFNREVGADGALYFNKEVGNLAALIEKCELFNNDKVEQIGIKARKRVESNYSWSEIINKYEETFLSNNII